MSQLDQDIDLATLARMMKMPKPTLLRLLTILGLGLAALGRSAEKNFDLVDKIHPYFDF
jgi:hypothetical protein